MALDNSWDVAYIYINRTNQKEKSNISMVCEVMIKTVYC